MHLFIVLQCLFTYVSIYYKCLYTHMYFLLNSILTENYWIRETKNHGENKRGLIIIRAQLTFICIHNVLGALQVCLY